MRLLHVITGLNVGGAETMLARLVGDRHTAPEFEPEVASLQPPGFVGAQIAEAGVPIHDLGMRNIVLSGAALLRLARLIRANRPDLIMAWMHHGQIAATAAVALARTRTPVIWNVRHSLGGYAREQATTRAILRLQARTSDSAAAIVYNSRTAAKQYTAFGFSSARAQVIPNGFEVRGENQPRMDARALFGIAREPLLIGMVARAHPMKDVPNLVAAYARVRDAGIAAHLLLVGEGMDQPTRSVAEALSALPDGSWTVSGQRGDVADWLGSLDVLALPSAWGEGFPNVIGEAMASGVPCVATDVGDSRWVIGSTGRVVAPGDPVALADALIDFARLPHSTRRLLGSAAKARIVSRFALAPITERYVALCRDVVAAVPLAASSFLLTAVRTAA